MKFYSKLVLVSFVILFLELLLIRLIGTEIRIFAYFSNLLLLAIFVGSGLGMLIKKRLPITLSALLLLLTVGVFVPLGQMLGELLDSGKKLILAYSINVAASLAGMWFFQAESFLTISLFAGIALAQLLLLGLAANWSQRKLVFFCLLVS